MILLCATVIVIVFTPLCYIPYNVVSCLCIHMGSVLHVRRTDSVLHVRRTDSVLHVRRTDSVLHVRRTDSVLHVRRTDSVLHVCHVLHSVSIMLLYCIRIA